MLSGLCMHDCVRKFCEFCQNCSVSTPADEGELVLIFRPKGHGCDQTKYSQNSRGVSSNGTWSSSVEFKFNVNCYIQYYNKCVCLDGTPYKAWYCHCMVNFVILFRELEPCVATSLWGAYQFCGDDIVQDLLEPASLVKKREEWMVKLPPEMTKNFGVTARKFSTKTATSVDKDRSAWTDTPADRARKEQV